MEKQRQIVRLSKRKEIYQRLFDTQKQRCHAARERVCRSKKLRLGLFASTWTNIETLAQEWEGHVNQSISYLSICKHCGASNTDESRNATLESDIPSSTILATTFLMESALNSEMTFKWACCQPCVQNKRRQLWWSRYQRITFLCSCKQAISTYRRSVS